MHALRRADIPIVCGVAALKILVVDDEPTVREVVAQYLTRDGFEVCELDRGDVIESTVQQFRPDLIVLDIMLPGGNGLDYLRRAGSDRVPVILLTAHAEVPDRVLGLELGADDYLTKPFSPRELVARVRTVLRRSQSVSEAGSLPTEGEVLRFDGLCINIQSREVFVNGELVALTAKEFDLLAFLAETPRQVYSRAQLLQHVWDSSADYQDPATVTVHVRRLRNKIEANPEQPRWVTTIWGVGYRFDR